MLPVCRQGNQCAVVYKTKLHSTTLHRFRSNLFKPEGLYSTLPKTRFCLVPFLPPDYEFDESAVLEWAIKHPVEFPFWTDPYLFTKSDGYQQRNPILVGYVSIKASDGFERLVNKAIPYKGLRYVAIYTDNKQPNGYHEYYGMKADETAVLFNKDAFTLLQSAASITLECSLTGVTMVSL